MKILKHILLLNILLTFPIAAFCQLGNKRIVLSSGDTVRVVNQRALLSKQDINFLRRDSSNQSPLFDYKSDYSSIEEAALDLERLLGKINTSKSLSQKNNESLSVRIATRNLRNLKKEQDIQNTWDSIITSEPPMEELKQLYKLFDGKPSYFINDVMVKPQVVDRLRQNEILNRSIRTINTATGNPNGEIWYEVTPQAFKRLKIEESTTLDLTLPAPTESSTLKEEDTPQKQEVIIRTTPDAVKSDKKDREEKKQKKRSVRKIKEDRAKRYQSAD